MANYADMQARILDELANDGDLTASQVNNAIQDAIKYYERNEWWFNSNISTFSTVSDQEYYTLANFSDLPSSVSLLAMTVSVTGVNNSLRGVDFQSINDVQTGQVKGIPRFFAYFDQALRLFPIPSAVYTLTVAYVYRLPALVNGTDENAWTNDAEELIRQSAKRRLAMNILFADEIAGRCKILETEAYDGLRRENRMRRSQQDLRTDIPRARRTFSIITG